MYVRVHAYILLFNEKELKMFLFSFLLSWNGPRYTEYLSYKGSIFPLTSLYLRIPFLLILPTLILVAKNGYNTGISIYTHELQFHWC